MGAAHQCAKGREREERGFHLPMAFDRVTQRPGEGLEITDFQGTEVLLRTNEMPGLYRCHLLVGGLKCF